MVKETSAKRRFAKRRALQQKSALLGLIKQIFAVTPFFLRIFFSRMFLLPCLSFLVLIFPYLDIFFQSQTFNSTFEKQKIHLTNLMDRPAVLFFSKLLSEL